MDMNMMMMMRYNPFTASQWQELEHQALVFKYMASGIPVPPDLLRRTTTITNTNTNTNNNNSSPLIGWRFEMGLTGKKTDPEPGRCRRTDGKKWRCSKDVAFPHSKYCQRHIHRGTTKNHHRNTTTTTTNTAAAIKTNYFRPPPPPPSQLNTTKDIINVRTAMRSVDPAGHNESSSSSSSVSSSSLSSKLTMGSLISQMKHDNNNNNIEHQHQHQHQKRNVMMHHNFLEEWSSAKTEDSETTQLSTSIPNSYMHDFFQTNE